MREASSSQFNGALLRRAVSEAERASKLFPGRENEIFIGVLVAQLLAGTDEAGGVRRQSVAPAVKPPAIGELFAEKKPRSEPQKAVVCAYYLEQVQGLSSFSVDDLEKTFVSVKEKVPGNLNDVMNKSIKKGWVMEVPEGKDGKKAWCLTRSGIEVVRAGFARKT